LSNLAAAELLRRFQRTFRQKIKAASEQESVSCSLIAILRRDHPPKFHSRYGAAVLFFSNREI
jgi:hypothetical protein